MNKSNLVGLSVLILVMILITSYIFFPIIKPTNQRLDLLVKELEKEQKRFGVQCIDGDRFILSYVDRAVHVAEKLGNEQRLNSSDPIILQGEKISDFITKCSLLNRWLRVEDHSLGDLHLEDSSVQVAFQAIRLSLSQSASKWCGVECIDAQRKEVFLNASLLRQIIEEKSMASEKRVSLNRPETLFVLHKIPSLEKNRLAQTTIKTG